MPRSHDPAADAQLILETVDATTAGPEGRVYLWMGLDLAFNQRGVAIALVTQLEAWMAVGGMLDEMRRHLARLREPIVTKGEPDAT